MAYRYTNPDGLSSIDGNYPATGKWDWDFTNWFSKDKPGWMLGITINTSFTNTTFFASMNWSNGSNTTLGYNTQYGWGGGSAPQNMYFPNYNSGASEAAAVSSIARVSSFDMNSTQGSYMDNLIYNTMTRTIVFAFNQFHVVSSIGPLGPVIYRSGGGFDYSNPTAGFESNITHPWFAPGYVPYSSSSCGSIDNFEPNIAEIFSTSWLGQTVIGRTVYGIVDDSFVTLCCFTIGHKEARHINGSGVIGNETVGSGLNTMTTFVPVSSFSKFLGMSSKPLNGAKYNSLYKGTGITAAKDGGKFIRQFNGSIRTVNGFNFYWNFFFNPISIFGSYSTN